MFDYQGLLVDKSFDGLPRKLISKITIRAGLLIDSRSTPRTGGKKERKGRGDHRTQEGLIDERVTPNKGNATTRIEEKDGHRASYDEGHQDNTCKKRNEPLIIQMRTVTRCTGTEVKHTLDMDHQRSNWR